MCSRVDRKEFSEDEQSHDHHITLVDEIYDHLHCVITGQDVVLDCVDLVFSASIEVGEQTQAAVRLGDLVWVCVFEVFIVLVP